MKVAVLCLVILALAVAVLARPSSKLLLDPEFISELNSQGGWVAGHNKRFEGMTMEDAKKLLGTKLDRPNRAPKKVIVPTEVNGLPDSFDARTQWPHCVHPIRDQAQCGSCWAFGATEALSDRFCIASNGAVSVVLSPQELVSCDSTDYGCQGGYLDNAWAYMVKTGVPTEQCYPYASASGNVPACKKTCSDGSAMKYYKAKNYYDIKGGAAAIQQELMKNGPIEVAFEVYQDFFAYKSGVYTHKSGGLAGGHAVKLVGWGVDNGTPYWIVANSWGTSWGQNGFFWIKRGTDECGIEDNAVAGLADVSSLAEDHTPIPSVVMDLNAPVHRAELIAAVNADKTSTWVAGVNKRFEGVSLKEAKKLLGTKMDRLPAREPVVLHAANIPSSFDARTQWPSCVHPIRDQGQCGSCWAFGATESFSDRLCIATNGATNVVLSPQDLVSCDTTNYGCQGGYLNYAWEFMANSGVVADTCWPYQSSQGTAPSCRSTCVNGSPFTKYFVDASSIQTYTDEASIQTAIMTNGPVEAAFSVYEDFFSYKSGVYTHKTGGLAGGHAIKIVGWGEDNGTPYWIVANSWGTSWGLNGFFWIKRGSDECGIEEQVTAGLPKH